MLKIGPKPNPSVRVEASQQRGVLAHSVSKSLALLAFLQIGEPGMSRRDDRGRVINVPLELGLVLGIVVGRCMPKGERLARSVTFARIGPGAIVSVSWAHRRLLRCARERLHRPAPGRRYHRLRSLDADCGVPKSGML